MGNPYLFKATIQNTISSQYIHGFLIVIEYIISFFPYISSSISKIRDDSFSYLYIEKKTIIFPPSEYTLTIMRSPILFWVTFSFMVISALFSFVYLLLKKFYNAQNPSKASSLLLNFLNIILFRYFSFVFMNSTWFWTFYFAFQGNIIKNLLAIVTLSLQIFYLVTAFQYISEYNFYCHITNRKIFKDQVKYPFDSFSEEIDKYFFFLKLTISFEYNFSNYKGNNQNYFSIVISSVLVAYSVFLFLLFLVKKPNRITFLHQFIANKNLNLFRKFIITFNFILVVQKFIFSTKDNYLSSSNLVVNFFTSLLLINFLKNYHQKYTFNAFLEENHPDIFVFLFASKISSNDSTEDTTTKSKKNDYDSIILSKLKSMHVIRCKNKPDCEFCGSEKTKSDMDYQEIFQIFNSEYRKLSSLYPEYLFNFLKFLHSYTDGNNYDKGVFFYKLFSDKKTPKIIKNTASCIFFKYIIDDQKFSNYYVHHSIELCDFSAKTRQIIQDFLAFVTESFENQRCNKLLKISKDLYYSKKNFYIKLLDVESKAQGTSTKSSDPKPKQLQELQLSKRMQIISNYAMVLFRYIFETLTNEAYAKLRPLNIETFEDFLNMHFHGDKFMILSYNLSGKENQNFKIIKITGITIKDEVYLGDFFPKRIRKDGNYQLLSVIQKKSGTRLYSFSFLLELNHFYESFLLEFGIGHSLVPNQVLLFGFFELSYEKILTLCFDGNFAIIKGISKEMLKVLGLRKEILEIIRNTIEINFEFFFKNIKLYQGNSETVSNSPYGKITRIKAQLCYSDLFKKVIELVKQNTFETSKENGMKIADILSKMKKDAENLKGTSINITFKKLFLINEQECCFRCQVEKPIGNPSLKALLKNNDKFGTAVGHSASSNPSSDSYKNLHPFDSTGSMTENTETDSSTFARIASRKKQEVVNNIPIIRKEIKKISIISVIILGLNIILFVLCFMFLFIQNVETNKIKNVLSLLFSFKTLRHKFYNVFYSTASLTCLVDKDDLSSTCDNQLIKLATKYERGLGLKEHQLTQFFWYELGYKVNEMKDYYTEFKAFLLTKKFAKFHEILDNLVIYNYIQRDPGVISNIKTRVTFNEGIEKMINSGFHLISTDNNKTLFPLIPYYIITTDKGVYYMSEIKNQDWNEYQTEMFNVIINFVNFYSTYVNTDELIVEQYNTDKERNLAIIIIFMIVFILLNYTILGFNLQHLKYSELLFQKLLAHSIFKIQDTKTKEFLANKIKALLDLSQLYLVNPNSLIKNISTNEEKWKAAQKKKITSKNKTTQESIDRKIEGDFEKFTLNFSRNSFHMKDFTKKEINPIFLKNLLLYIFYIVVIGVFDVVIILIETNAFTFAKYVRMNYEIMTYVLADMSVLYIYHLINTTESNLNKVLGNSKAEDGLINGQIRESLEMFRESLKLGKNSNFPNQESYYVFDCDKLYDEVDDEIFRNYKEKNGVEHVDNFPEKVCKDLNFENFTYFLHSDYFSLLAMLHNKHYDDRSFEGMYAILKDEIYFRSFLYLHFYFRPVKWKFNTEILYPLINDKISLYVKFLWVYLILNIVIEWLIFILYRIIISRELIKIKKYLSLFENCMK